MEDLQREIAMASREYNYGNAIADDDSNRESSDDARFTRRSLLATSGAAAALSLLPTELAAAGDSAIRPFHINIPEAALVDLRRRIVATRWPDMETVNDRSQGVQLAKIKPLVRHWGQGHDWRKAETKLNALPQFMTKIDGLDIQFAHVRSRHANAMPLIMTHGWPGSILELIKVI